MESSSPTKNSLLTNYFVSKKVPSAKKEEAAAADQDVFDYGETVSTSKTSCNESSKNGAAIGKQYYAKGPEFYRFPMVLECTIVNRELFTQNH